MVDLIIIVILSMVLVPLVEFSSGTLRIILGLVFTIFSPGYTIVAALFPRKSDIGGIERIALSFGLSIAVVPLLGFVLNFTSFGIRLYPVLISIMAFIVIMTLIALYRRRRFSPEEQFRPNLKLRLDPLIYSWVHYGRRDRIFNVLLVFAILGAMGSFAYGITNPQGGERFTEFYVLDQDGKTDNYPSNLLLGDNAAVILGIVNHEHQSTLYRIEITIDGQNMDTLDLIDLGDEEEWQKEVSLAPLDVGLNQLLEFHLYKNSDEGVYLETHLIVNVRERSVVSPD